MENQCKNCRWYNNGKCCNQEFVEMVSGTTPKDSFISLTETGELAEYIREYEDNEAYELATIVLDRLTELGYIKKTKKKIWNFEEVDDNEDFLINFTEIMDSIISSFVMESISNMQMDYSVNPEFGCRFWE